MNLTGHITIDVADGARGRFIRATWLNGVMPMHADITGPASVMAVRRLAAEIGAGVNVTDAAEAAMKEEGWRA